MTTISNLENKVGLFFEDIVGLTHTDKNNLVAYAEKLEAFITNFVEDPEKYLYLGRQQSFFDEFDIDEDDEDDPILICVSNVRESLEMVLNTAIEFSKLDIDEDLEYLEEEGLL